jgi:hypothetical protein
VEGLKSCSQALGKIQINAIGSLLIGTERLRCAGQISAMEIAGGEAEPTRNVQGTRAVLARGDVQVRVGREGVERQ